MQKNERSENDQWTRTSSQSGKIEAITVGLFTKKIVAITVELPPAPGAIKMCIENKHNGDM